MPSAALPAALATSRLVKSLDIVDPGPFAAEDDRARSAASFAKAANVKQANLAPARRPVQEEAAHNEKARRFDRRASNSCRQGSAVDQKFRYIRGNLSIGWRH